MKKIFAMLFCACGIANAQTPHHCSADAGKQAQRLLAFHFNQQDDRIEIDKKITVLPSIRNPANKNQSFDVLEVWGHIYKGQYRMRFIYAQIKNDCALMGEEILEFASL